MTKSEAAKQLNTGYVLFISGMIFGVLIHKDINQNIFLGTLIFGYFFWATYWGYKIMYSKFSTIFNTPVHIEAKSLGDYVSKNVIFMLLSEFFKFWVCYFVGALGGGLIKQIQLSKIAYF